VRTSPTLTRALKQRFQRQMQALAGGYGKRGRGRAFAVDGPRVETPHRAANEGDLGGARRDKTAPQVFLTTFLPRGTGLPWDDRVGSGTGSKRAHLKRRGPDLPPRSLVVADAGFVGSVLGRKLILRGPSFLLRGGRNLTPLTGLGSYPEERNGFVSLAPPKPRCGRPLVLRLIPHRQDKPTVDLLTNVRDEKERTGVAAATWSAMRWGEAVGVAGAGRRRRSLEFLRDQGA
jgi:hypothetical protein